MCGIFGFVSKDPLSPKIVFSGLKDLEYRGYDSWGIATKAELSNSKLKTQPVSPSLGGNSKLVVYKKIGKLPEKLDSKLSAISSKLSIGHTRWATHGGVTNANAHPHTDCTDSLALVHNGIFENYEEIKNALIKKGHKFKSETDTEVIVHLIEEELKTQTGKTKQGFATSTRSAFKKLQGMNAFVVMNSESKEIIAAKNGSPLIVGVGRNAFYISSDISSILPHTKKIIILKDDEMVILGEKVKLISLSSGKELTPIIENIKWDIKPHEKGAYKHFFIKEIHEEPEVIRRIAVNAVEGTKTLSEYIEKAYGTFIVACGSASYAGIAATYLFSQIAKKHINISVGSEFKYQEDFITNKTLVLPISQSGESIDVIEPVTRVKAKGATIASIVNVMGSTLYRMSDFNVLLESGTEKAVVATKSFTAMVATLILTAYTLAGKSKEGQELLLEASRDVSKILSPAYIKKIKSLAKRINERDHLYVIGRGLSYAAALEATLKLKEASYAHAEAFPGGELKHGVIALIEKGTPCIVFAPNDETYDEIISNAQEVKVRGGFIIGIGPRESSVFDVFLKTGDIKHATILSQVAVSHLLGYYLSLARGVEDPDKPRNLAKSVTVK